MQTVVVTDSSAVTDPAPHLQVVPVTLLFPDGEVTDHRGATDRVVRAVEQRLPVKSRAPSIVDYVEAVEASEADAAVIITPAAELTTMWRNATNAVYLSDRPIAVVDSRSAAAGQALVVEAARQCAADRGTLADVVAAAENAARRVRLIATVPSAGPIASSGLLPADRVRQVRGGRNPLFRFAGGSIEVARVTPDGTDPAAALADLWLAEGGMPGEPMTVFTTAGSEDVGARLASAIGAGPPEPASAVMMVYAGTGVVGLAWLNGATGTTNR
ncbi:MAG TPA: DegV family protein [Acidimicrobiales bacterium]